jgi:hypothetical protein
MSKFKIIMLTVFGVILMLVIGFGFRYYDLIMFKFFGIRYENVRRNIFEQSQSYNQGMKQELENMQFQIEQADDSHKTALAQLMRHRVAYYGYENLTPSLQRFVDKIKTEGRW